MNDTGLISAEAVSAVNQKPEIGTSAGHWFGRGFAGGFLVLAALNAGSWFWLTPGWGDLVGRTVNADVEAIGFPMEIWREGSSYGSAMISWPNVLINLLCGVVVGIVLGLWGVANRQQFTQWVIDFESRQPTRTQSRRMQFSVFTILIWTTVVALLLALLNQWSGTWQGLAGVYLLGPAAIIGIGMAPRKLGWQVRAAIVAGLSMIVIGTALYSGHKLGMPLDRVMLGFFVCWTPQSVFTALAITLGMIWKLRRGI